MTRTISLISFFLLLLVSGAAQAGQVTLSVAASMRDVMNTLTDDFSSMNPGVKVLKNYGGSGALAVQIENGAPSDIFISANPQWMDYLKGKKLVNNPSVRVFAYNTLVFAGRTDKRVTTLKDVLKLERVAIGSPQSVPAGEYAKAALTKAGIFTTLEKRLVMTKDVRQCLMYAEFGEVDGSFVYRTDALLAKKARILFTVPQDLYPRVTYPMGLTRAGAKNGDARNFYRFLSSQEARTVLQKYGFALH